MIISSEVLQIVNCITIYELVFVKFCQNLYNICMIYLQNYNLFTVQQPVFYLLAI